MSKNEETSIGFRGEYDFLSNFYEYDFFMKDFNEVVKSGEHAYAALKTRDKNKQIEILAAPTPKDAKKLGRRVKILDNWDKKYRLPAMTVIINQKFNVPELSLKLLETGNVKLVEYNLLARHVFWQVHLPQS